MTKEKKVVDNLTQMFISFFKKYVVITYSIDYALICALSGVFIGENYSRFFIFCFFDFWYFDVTSFYGIQHKCREYAVITEPLNGLRLVVCGLNGFYRHQHVYTSRSNLVRLQMAAWPQRNPVSTSASGNDVTSARYVIRYEGRFCCGVS